MDGCVTDLSFFDAGVDGFQQVGSVLVALGEFSQFFPDQLPLLVAHHPLKRWVHILGQNKEGVKGHKNGTLIFIIMFIFIICISVTLMTLMIIRGTENYQEETLEQ